MKHSALTTALTTVATIGAIVFLIVWLPRQNGKTGAEIFGLQTHEEALECQRKYWSVFKYQVGDRVKILNSDIEGVVLSRRREKVVGFLIVPITEKGIFYRVKYLDRTGQVQEETFDQTEIQKP